MHFQFLFFFLHVKYNLNDVSSICGGMSFSMALKKDGTVWLWEGMERYGLGEVGHH